MASTLCVIEFPSEVCENAYAPYPFNILRSVDYLLIFRGGSVMLQCFGAGV